MDTNIDKKYITSNLHLAAALYAKGCTLLDYSKDTSGKTNFIFDYVSDCEKYEKQWLTNTLEVKAFDFFQGLRLLKSILYGER